MDSSDGVYLVLSPTSNLFRTFVFFPPYISRAVNNDESTKKGVNLRSKYVAQVQQQRPKSPTVTLTWHACRVITTEVHKLHSIGVY